MKKLNCLLLILICVLKAAAQTSVTADQEKLLELYQTQRYSEAAAYLQSTYGNEVTTPKELSQIAYANMMSGNLQVAEKSYLRLHEQQPGSLPILFNLAGISQRRGDTQKAKDYYREIIKIDSLNFNVYRQLASLLLNPLDLEKLIYLKKANKINPTHADIAFDLATSLHLFKKSDSAYTVLQPAIAADTGNMILLKAKLPICIALKKMEEAMVTGENLMAHGDSSTYVISNMGKAYFATQQYEKALKMFLYIESQQQQTEGSLYYTALCYRELKNYPQAGAYIKLSIKEGISPLTATYYKSLGEIYEKRAQIQKANQSYQKSLEFDNNGEVYYNMALLNDGNLNNKKAAVKYYQQFLSSKPDTAKYKEVIIYVQGRLKNLKK